VAVSTRVFSGSAQGEQDEALRPSVDELATHSRTDPSRALWTEHVLGPLDEQGQLTPEHEVDLFSFLVRVNASPLAGLDHDEVHPERPTPNWRRSDWKRSPLLRSSAANVMSGPTTVPA